MGKLDNFSEWYNDVIERAELVDKRYPVKGMDIWRPYGLRVMRLIDNYTREEMERTDHDEVEFPLLVPETQFAKESDHIKGFEDEVYWVRHGGLDELEVPLVVRPTSETAMYPMFSLWIRSHADLPLKIFQIVSVFRYDTKQTRSFMRVREIHFFEAHTAHRDYDDAEAQIRQDAEIWQRLADKMCLPYVLARRPEWDKFPGAHYTVAADVIMPERKTLQCATFHHYRDNFAKPYDIQYEGEDGEHHHAHQTTYGMSERLVGAVVGVHGDDQGLILPPDVAPIQAIVVPIIFKGKEAPVLDATRDALSALKAAGVRSRSDERDETAGFKFNDWELRGVPVRVEIGPRDVENGQAMIATRHDGEKTPVKLTELAEGVEAALQRVKEGLQARAQSLLEENLRDAKTADEARDAEGVVRLGWCGDTDCGLQIEEAADKSVLGTPLEADGVTPQPHEGECAACGKPTGEAVLVAKTY